MMNTKILTVEEKIKMIREFMGYTQETFGELIGTSKSTVARYESQAPQHAKFVYSDEDIEYIKEKLGIKGAPLREDEYGPFKRKMYSWIDAMREDNDERARILHEELHVAVYLLFYPELMLLYFLFEIKWLLRNEDLRKAEEKMKLVEIKLENVSTEVLFEYYYTSGTMYFYKGDYEKALEFYKAANNYEIDSFDRGEMLSFNIAICYTELGRCISAISSLERVYNRSSHERANVTWLSMANTLALNCMKIGNTVTAKQIFGRALPEAEIIGNDYYSGRTLHNLGCVFVAEKNFKKALEYFTKAATYIENDDNFFLENLFYKAFCLTVLGRPESRDIIAEGESLSLKKEDEYYTLLFQTLYFLPNLSVEKYRDTIEQKTIPYLEGKHQYFKATLFCEQLRGYYTKITRKMKIFETESILHRLLMSLLK